MPGRRVIAQRWEGVAEGIRFIPQSLQNFRNTIPGGPQGTSFNAGTSSGGGSLSTSTASAPASGGLISQQF